MGTQHTKGKMADHIKGKLYLALKYIGFDLQKMHVYVCVCVYQSYCPNFCFILARNEHF